MSTIQPAPAKPARSDDELGSTVSIPPRVDGRSARALRTREAIVDACIGLLEEGDFRPTGPAVAERAGVSVRSVFQHFDDLPSLHMAVADRITERISVLLVQIDPSLPFDDRVRSFVRHRAALLEALTPFRRAANVHGPFAPEIRKSVRVGVEFLHSQVTQTFQPELDRLAHDDRQQVSDGLVAALSWPAWEALRSEGERNAEAASDVVERTVRALLTT